jgi:hypothetical protein
MTPATFYVQLVLRSEVEIDVPLGHASVVEAQTLPLEEPGPELEP